MTIEEKVSQIAQLLDTSRYVLVLTGSNLAREVGIPNFRQATLGSCASGCHHGEGHSCQENDCQGGCSPEEFTLHNLQTKPENIYRICFALLQAISQAKPTTPYQTLTNLEQMKIIKGLITENIDSLHQVAGSQNILEIYGNMRGAACQNCQQKIGVPALVKKIQEKEMPPRCPQCNGLLKPNLIFNDESLPKDFQAAQEEIKKADLLLVIGSDLDLPASRYLANSASKLVIINSQPTPLDNRAEVVIHGDLNEILSSLWEKVQEELGF